MVKGLVVAALIGAIGFGGAARADMLGGGPVTAGTSSIGGTVQCRIFNYGVYAVSVPARQIFMNDGQPVGLANDTCSTVPITRACAFSAFISGANSYSCRAFVTGIDVKVSGMIEILNSNGTTAASVPFRGE